MCGRFTLRTPLSVLAKAFDFDMSTAADDFTLPPRYNIAPTQSIATLRASADSRQPALAMLRWGLVPSWADDPSIGNRLINARADTVAAKPAFRDAYKKRRCLVLADGYYEWQKVGKAKQPYLFHFADERPFTFAGLWERWRPAPDAAPIESCTIITTEANELFLSYHDRMPVILDARDRDEWLNAPVAEISKLARLLAPWTGDSMIATAVSTHVNNPRHEDPACAAPSSPI